MQKVESFVLAVPLGRVGQIGRGYRTINEACRATWLAGGAEHVKNDLRLAVHEACGLGQELFGLVYHHLSSEVSSILTVDIHHFLNDLTVLSGDRRLRLLNLTMSTAFLFLR